MRLAVARIATCLPERQQHDNLLGSVVSGAYRHLYDPAGNHARPPAVRRGTMRLYSQPYSAPTAPAQLRTSEMGSAAVAQALEGAPGCAERVEAVLHTHCTLDQQILGSACLRIAHDHFPRAATFLSVGQLGTAGVPTALRLAASATASGRLACVSASDKWLAPMVRHQPGVVTYGDASAACLVGSVDEVDDPLAVVEAIHTVCQPNPHGVWGGDREAQRAWLLDLAAGAVEDLLRPLGGIDRAGLALCGDGYGADFAAALQRRCRLGGELLAVDDGAIHLSSAAPLFALDRVIAAAPNGHPSRAVIWAASTAGHAAAMLVAVPARSPSTNPGHPGQGEPV